MPERPWVLPHEVRDYTEIKAVSERTDTRIAVDISRAEQYVIKHTHNDFSDYETIPQNVKTAVILLAEAYGYNSAVTAKEVKSETFDDYSYTADCKTISFDTLGLDTLLDEYRKEQPKNNVTMRLRRL